MPIKGKSTFGNCFTFIFWVMKSISASKRLLISSTVPSTIKNTQGTSHQVLFVSFRLIDQRVERLNLAINRAFNLG